MTAYQVKPESVPAATGVLTTPEVHRILTGLDPVALQDAGAAHTQLGRELDAVAAHLAQEAGTLTEHWSGPAARTALTQFQRLHQQAAALATQATRTGAVLTWLGTQVIPAFQHPADPAQAHEYLTHLTADLIKADTSLPAHIGTATSTGAVTSTGSSAGVPAGARAPATTGPTSPTDHGSTIGVTHPAVSSLQSAAPAPPPSSPTATAASPAPPAGPATNPAPAPAPMTLASAADSPRASSTPPDPAEPDPAAPASPDATSDAAASAEAETEATAAFLPLAPSLPTGVTSSSGSQKPGEDHESQQAPTAQTASAGTLATTPLPAHATTAVSTPGNGHFFPTPAGVTTPPDQERHRDAWISEDRNLWGLPAGCVPPVIAGS